MGIRMSGLSSGMDTEAIVKELMSAQSMKKNKVVKAKTKLEWTQTKWSELNTKLTGLYNNFVSKMQLSTAYKTRKQQFRMRQKQVLQQRQVLRTEVIRWKLKM